MRQWDVDIQLELAMQTGRATRKRGFTLIETVVSVGIVAALAAVVYPNIVKQFDTADPARVVEDLNNIRTAVETFGVNIRPHQPDDIEDLVLQPVASTGPGSTQDSTARGTTYTAAEVANWLGPYLSVSVAADVVNEAVVITTGFAATIPNHFGLYDVASPTEVGGDTVSTANVANADFLAVRITGLSGPAYNAVNLLIDGPLEDTPQKRRQQGRLRCPHGAPTATDATACATAFYLAVPIR